MNDKPPIGCTPGWLVAENRLYELIAAFKRNVECRDSIPYMRLWLKEMQLQLDIIENYK